MYLICDVDEIIGIYFSFIVGLHCVMESSEYLDVFDGLSSCYRQGITQHEAVVLMGPQCVIQA